MKHLDDFNTAFHWKKWCGYVFLLMLFCCIPLLTILKHQYVKTTETNSIGDLAVHEMVTGDRVQQRLFFDGELHKLSFLVANGLHEIGYNSGILKVILQQGDQIYTQSFDISQMGDWVYIPLEIDGCRFGAGEAILTFESLDTESGWGIYLPFANSPEGSLPAMLNQTEQSGPLMLKYEEHTVNKTFVCSLLWMFLLMILACWTAYLLVRDSAGKWIFLSVSGIIFCALCIRVPLLTYQAEFFWETGEDFFAHAKWDGFFENLLSLEAGLYLSWLTRLIAFFWVKLVGAVRFAPLSMQLTVVCISIIWCAFPCLDYFEKYASKIVRVVFSLLVILVIPENYMYTYMSFVYFGILFLTELYFISLNELQTWKFVLCLLLATLIIMTKIQYVAVIPVAVILLILFWRKGIRWRLYSTMLILAGLVQGLATVALRGTEISKPGFATIHFQGIADLVNSVFYQMVQLYSSVFGGSSEISNVLSFILIITLAVVCITYLIRTRGKSICMWIVVVSHILIAATFAVHRIGLVSEVARNDTDWSVSWNAGAAWRLPGWVFGCYVALVISGIAILYWIFIEKEMLNKKYFSFTCVLLFSIFLIKTTNWYNPVYQEERGYASGWSNYADKVKNNTCAIQIHADWYVLHNSRVVQISDVAIYDGCIMNPEEENSEVLAVYAQRKLTQVGLDYVAKFYDSSGKLMETIRQTNSRGRNWAGFYLDEPLSGIAYIEFELEDGSRAYTGDIEVAVVDMSEQAGGV